MHIVLEGIVTVKTKDQVHLPSPIKMKNSEALSLKVQCDMSDSQYQMIRNSSKQQNADIYPTLHELLLEKQKCYPSDIEFTETTAFTSLQSMCDHTLSRLMELDETQISLQPIIPNENEGILYFKVGFGGASFQKI